MSSVFFYEPFYDLDRFLDEAFGSTRRPVAGNDTQLQRRDAAGDGAVRAFKPRYVSSPSSVEWPIHI
jgi:HSP20 family protein